MMDSDPNTASYPARLLTVHPDPAFVRHLSSALQPKISPLTIEHCVSAPEARRLLSESSCQAIIVSPTLIIQREMSVLTSSQRVTPPVPVIMTLRADEREVAQNWLDLGVYDFILDPFDPEEALESVQEALLLSQIRTRIHRTEEALLRLQMRREAYNSKAATDTSPRREVSQLQQQSILRLAESKESLGETLIALERTMKQLKQHRRERELYAKHRAEQRLGCGPSGRLLPPDPTW
ncbi:MAG: hypothetical protein QM771_15360 [Nitrospira sp.]